MKSLPVLPVLTQPWANGGERAEIPNASTGTNRASLQEGWGNITSTPIKDGGVPPNRLDFNGLGYYATIFSYAMQSGKFWTFDNAVVNAIGGYPKGAVLWKVDSNGLPEYLVVSLLENNTNNFQQTPSFIDGVKWKKLSLNPYGDAMKGTLSDKKAIQLRNIAIVDTEPDSGEEGVIYAIVEQ